MMRKKISFSLGKCSRSPLKSFFLVSCLCLSLLACARKGYLSRGHEFNEAALAQVKVGISVDRVLDLMGSPSTITTVGNKTFYYIGQHMKKGSSAFGHRVVEQRVVAIIFNAQFKVSRINTYALNNGVLVSLNKEETPTETLDKGLFQKLFGGVGTFSPIGGLNPESKSSPSMSGK